MPFTKEADEIFRDYVTDDVPLSGAHQPPKSDIRTWGTELEEQIEELQAAVSGDGDILGNVRGPTDPDPSIDGHVAVWTDAEGRELGDGGALGALAFFDDLDRAALSFAAAPVGGEAEGSGYIVTTGTGDFTGWDDSFARLVDGEWTQEAPKEGMLVWVIDQKTPYVYTDGDWQVAGGGRRMLFDDLTLYVGKTIPMPTITIATPAVVSSTAHGLAAGAPVVFNVPRNRFEATVSIASPGVVSKVGHGLTAGRPIKFGTAGVLPTGITAGTTYYVIATGLTADAFQFSATPGGAAVNTSVSQSGVHFVSTVGVLPTGIVEGTTYYVIAAGLTSNAFEVSATLGGSAVNTSGSVSGSPVYGAYTGSDTAGDGTAGSPYLTGPHALDALQAYDCNSNAISIQYCNGAHPETFYVGDGTTPLNAAGLYVFGNATDPWLVTDIAFSVQVRASAVIYGGFEPESINGAGWGGITIAGKMSYPAGGSLAHISAADHATISNLADETIEGGTSAAHTFALDQSKIVNTPTSLDLIDVPDFDLGFLAAYLGGEIYAPLWQTGIIVRGTATGPEASVSGNSQIETLGDGAPGSSPATVGTESYYG